MTYSYFNNIFIKLIVVVEQHKKNAVPYRKANLRFLL